MTLRQVLHHLYPLARSRVSRALVCGPLCGIVAIAMETVSHAILRHEDQLTPIGSAVLNLAVFIAGGILMMAICGVLLSAEPAVAADPARRREERRTGGRGGAGPPKKRRAPNRRSRRSRPAGSESEP